MFLIAIDRSAKIMIQFLANGLCKGAVFAMVGLGFGLIYTTTRVFHIAHAGIYVLAGYVLMVAMVWWKLPLIIAILLVLVVVAFTGMLLEYAVYGPLARRSASAAVILVSSLGLQIIFENVIAMSFGNQTQIIRAGVDQTLQLGPLVLSYVQIAQFVVGMVLVAAFWLFLKHTRAGQLCRAVSDDETLASVLGVRVTRVRLLVFALGSVFAGMGAVLVSLDVGMDPHVGFPVVLAAAVACIIGGLRNFLAPAIGGILLGVIQSLVVWQTSAKWEAAVTFGILIVFVLFRRQGLFGVSQRAEEA